MTDVEITHFAQVSIEKVVFYPVLTVRKYAEYVDKLELYDIIQKLTDRSVK